ncbi:MAG: ATP-binding protein [Chitinophagaceae bacterium]|nr:ATP-binding protein [Chitinophagaceae bacterium]
MKINSIQFFDYRAFFNGQNDQYFLKIDGKNVLIYGENGSGKTSFYRGLKDFFHGEDFVVHNQTPRLNEGFIEIVFSDGTTERLEASGLKPLKAEVLNTPKLNSFLSYKELLKTHLEDADEINLFELLVDSLLREHSLASLGTLSVAWDNEKSKNLQNETQEITQGLEKGEINNDEAKEQIEIAKDRLKDQHAKFIDELKLLLVQINDKLTSILDYFNQNIEVKIELDSVDWDNPLDSKIILKVKHFGITVDTHHDFLNEARLSAIAISIYLAAIKLNPTQNAVKFLCLDDIFLGLDMGNRLPLLEILEQEFNDWQIILTTYDRHWFEVAKVELGSTNWQHLEMYSAQNNIPTFEYPVIIKESDNYLFKANKYYKTKDYPGCLNYLRKEIERLIKERLPEENVRHFDGQPHKLSHLWDVMIDRYNAIGTPVANSIKEAFSTTKLTLLNPLSHDNLSQPVYKHELDKAFNLIQDISGLPILKNITLLSKGMELHFVHPSHNYTFTFELLTDWRVEINNGNRTQILPKCKVKHWQFNNIDYWNFRTNSVSTETEITMVLNRDDRLNVLQRNLTNTPALAITIDLIERNTTFNNIWTLRRILDDSNNVNRGNWFTRWFNRHF